MIEHTIKNHTDSLSVTLFHKCLQIIVRSQTAVQLFIVCCFIPMSH